MQFENMKIYNITRQKQMEIEKEDNHLLPYKRWKYVRFFFLDLSSAVVGQKEANFMVFNPHFHLILINWKDYD